MPAQPNEPASESIKNALQVLNAEEPYESRGQRWVEYDAEDIEAIRARLEAALSKLEAPRTFLQHGANRDCPDVQVGRWTRCLGHHLTAEGRNLDNAQRWIDANGYPDQEERRGAASEAPLDYERPGQVDPVLRGQDVDADGE